MLLIDLVLHLVFYGIRTIYSLKKEYVYEAILQLIFISMIISYFSFDIT